MGDIWKWGVQIESVVSVEKPTLTLTSRLKKSRNQLEKGMAVN